MLAWLAGLLPTLTHAAGGASPFARGAEGGKAELLLILTPIAGVAVMTTGALAWFGRISWWWAVCVILGTILIFGADQVVGWIRGMAGV